MFTSRDGISWTQVTSAINLQNLLTIAYGNNTWIGVGQQNYVAFSKDNGRT